jgi:hypothetical protein
MKKWTERKLSSVKGLKKGANVCMEVLVDDERMG